MLNTCASVVPEPTTGHCTSGKAGPSPVGHRRTSRGASRYDAPIPSADGRRGWSSDPSSRCNSSPALRERSTRKFHGGLLDVRAGFFASRFRHTLLNVCRKPLKGQRREVNAAYSFENVSVQRLVRHIDIIYMLFVLVNKNREVDRA